MGVRFDEIVIDCAGPQSLAAFWSSVTGYELQSASERWAAMVGEGTRDICIAFQRVRGQGDEEPCSHRPLGRR